MCIISCMTRVSNKKLCLDTDACNVSFYFTYEGDLKRNAHVGNTA